MFFANDEISSNEQKQIDHLTVDHARKNLFFITLKNLKIHNLVLDTSVQFLLFLCWVLSKQRKTKHKNNSKIFFLLIDLPSRATWQRILESSQPSHPSCAKLAENSATDRVFSGLIWWWSRALAERWVEKKRENRFYTFTWRSSSALSWDIIDGDGKVKYEIENENIQEKEKHRKVISLTRSTMIFSKKKSCVCAPRRKSTDKNSKLTWNLGH